MAENKRMRDELLSAIRNEMAPKTSESEPLYDTLDDEGNIVTAPPWRVEEQVTFSAGRGAVNISHGGSRQEKNESKMTKRDIAYISLHFLHILLAIGLGIIATKALVEDDVGSC